MKEVIVNLLRLSNQFKDNLQVTIDKRLHKKQQPQASQHEHFSLCTLPAFTDTDDEEEYAVAEKCAEAGDHL